MSYTNKKVIWEKCYYGSDTEVYLEDVNGKILIDRVAANVNDSCYSLIEDNKAKQKELAAKKEELKVLEKSLISERERINADTDNLTDIFAALIDYITSIIGNIGILISVLMVNIYIGLAYCVFIVIIILYNRFSSNINYKNRKEYCKVT